MSKYNIKKAAAFLMVATAMEKILGFGREMVIASQFGATGLTDSYIAGYLIPNFIMVLLSAGLVNVYAPLFLTEYEKDHDKAWDKINSVSTYLMILLFAVTVIGIFISPYLTKLLYSGFNAEMLSAATSISKLFFIGVFIYSAAIIEGSILNSFRHFIYPVIALALLSISMIVFVIAFGGKTNINSIAAGYIAGAGLGLVLQFVKIKHAGGKLKPSLKVYPDFNARFISLFFPILVATSMSQVNVFVDRIFASHLPEGSMSYITYADKVTQLPIVIFSGIISTVIFPDLIQYINQRDFKKLKKYFGIAVVTTFMFAMPSYVGLSVLNNDIIKLLFERNAFDAKAVLNTASALLYYSPIVVTYSLIAVVSKVYYSMKDTSTLMYISISTIALNAILDFILMKPLLHDGLVLSTSIVSVLQFAAAYYILSKKVDISMGRDNILDIFKIVVASAAMGIVLFILKHFTVHMHIILSVGILIIAGASVYFILLLLLRVHEAGAIMDKLKGRRASN